MSGFETPSFLISLLFHAWILLTLAMLVEVSRPGPAPHSLMAYTDTPAPLESVVVDKPAATIVPRRDSMAGDATLLEAEDGPRKYVDLLQQPANLGNSPPAGFGSDVPR